MPRQVKDGRIKRYVVRLTLYEYNPDHVQLIEMLESSDNRGKSVVDAMISGAAMTKASIESTDDDLDDLFGDLVE